jgi:hypothetical protein
MLFLVALALALQNPQAVQLTRFEVLRVDPAGINRLPPPLRAIFVDPVPDAEAVSSLNEAEKQAGFSARLPKYAHAAEFGVTDSTSVDATIAVADLTDALQTAKAADVRVPQNWEAVKITVAQGRGILADYGDFLMVQSPPLTLNAPSGFALDQLAEVLFRIVGITATDARALRGKFAANPAVFFPIPTRFEMDIHEVRLKSGSGMLLQNASKVGDVALVWSTGNRSYFVTGTLTEAQVIAIADSIE